MVKWIREWTADPEIGVQVQVRVSEKKSLDISTCMDCL